MQAVRCNLYDFNLTPWGAVQCAFKLHWLPVCQLQSTLRHLERQWPNAELKSAITGVNAYTDRMLPVRELHSLYAALHC